MDRGADACIVKGVHSRYSCRSVAEVDRHLTAVTGWLAKTLPTLSAERRERVAAQYRPDIDVLLNARTMLVALLTLDAEVDALSAETPEGSTPGSLDRQHVPEPGDAESTATA